MTNSSAETVRDTPTGPAGRFEDVRRSEAIGRLRGATLALLPPLALALAVEIRTFGDTAPVRALALVGMLALAAVTHVLVAQHAAGRRAILIAVTFVLALGVLLLGVLAENPAAPDVKVAFVSAFMMAAAILVPWGFWPQLGVALVLAVVYVVVSATSDGGDRHVVTLVVSLADCVALSAIGAAVLDRQRRKAFAERAEAHRMSAQREMLLAASHELNASPDLEETAATIARVGCALVGSGTVGLVLVDDRRDVLHTAAVAGDVLDVDREVLHLEVPIVALQPLVDRLRAGGVLRLPEDGFEAMWELFREQFGLAAALYVGIERDGRLLGYLTFAERRHGAEFSEEQERVAAGFASQCAIALANARLVDDLQRASRVKSEFVSTMSHELRTPLSVILGYTDVLGDATTDLEARVVIDRMRVAGRELLELVESTLDLNRLESGQDPAHVEPIPMRELWDELAAQYDAVRRPEGVGLRWEVHGAPVALSDRRKLKIIVKNLVGNALKFTREGEVQASVRVAGDRCLAVVRDTGIGIPAEQLPAIFEMFHQLDHSDRRSFGGVGLGLYVVRKLAEQLGATLEVRSVVGKGTTFTVSLPLVSASETAAAA